MDLELTEEQDRLRETVRGVCARQCGLDVVRAIEADPNDYPEKLWVQFIELGLLDAELTMLDKAIVYQELGRALAPSPHFASAVVSAGALARAGMPTSNELIIVPAWLEPERGFGPSGVTARFDGRGVTGVKRHVPFAAAADRLLVLTRDGLVLVDAKAAGVTLTQQRSIASDTQYRVDLDGAPGVLVTDDLWPVWHDTMLDAVMRAAAQAVGGARYALDITVQSAKYRVRF